MVSLRQRFLLGTGLLLGLQIASTALALGSWTAVLRSADRESELAEWRVEVENLGTALREEYVHRAHTFIAGDASHLDHGREVDEATAERLRRVAALGWSAGDRARVEGIRQQHAVLAGYFEEQVVPLARDGALERAVAVPRHAQIERLTSAVLQQVDALAGSVEVAQAIAREEASQATTWAWRWTAGLSAGGVALLVLVARSLARAVLVPVAGIQRMAEAYGAGDRPAVGDELETLARAFEDVTDRLGVEQERRVRAERLAALGEWSAAVAHELANPLAVILGSSPGSDPVSATVRAEAAHAQRVVNGLLGFARSGEDRPTPLRLAEEVERAVERSFLWAEARGVSLSILEGASPVLDAPASAVRQVLDNLVRNAVEASPEGGAVEVELAEDSAAIHDRGPGIPRDLRPRLYEPFATGRPDGTGLGLAIAARVVRSMGGTLEHRDRPGGGTSAIWRWRDGEARHGLREEVPRG